MDTSNFFELGTIMKTRGLKGEVQIYFDGNKAIHYEAIEEIFIEVNKKLVPFQIEKIIFQKNVAYVYLEDVESVDAASKLLKKRVFLPVEMQEEVGPDFDPKHLVGYKVVDAIIGPVGTIREIMELPQQIIGNCLYQGKEVLLPLNDATITDVNEQTKTILMNLPEGLLDVYID